MLRTTQAAAVPVGAGDCTRQRNNAPGDGRLGTAQTTRESPAWTISRAHPAQSGVGRCPDICSYVDREAHGVASAAWVTRHMWCREHGLPPQMGCERRELMTRSWLGMGWRRWHCPRREVSEAHFDGQRGPFWRVGRAVAAASIEFYNVPTCPQWLLLGRGECGK
jgi:hypothetical protein